MKWFWEMLDILNYRYYTNNYMEYKTPEWLKKKLDKE